MEHNMNKFDYYVLCLFSYIGGFGCWIAWFMSIWITEYRWQLFMTGVALLLLNKGSETGIKMYKKSNS